jgi:nitroreductase
VALDRYGGAMELRDALRSTGSVREFTAAPVTNQQIAEILDDARFAPSGGNRQSWRVIVVNDPVRRRALRDLYLDGWHDYIAHSLAGLIPFSPLASEDDRRAAAHERQRAEALSRPEGFPERLHEVPALLVVCSDLSVLAAVDRDLGRYQIAGGASVYPFVWQILLAARDRGLGGVMTTIATRHEPEVRELFSIPETFAVASVVALGSPVKAASKLRRKPVDEFSTLDSFEGPALQL